MQYHISLRHSSALYHHQSSDASAGERGTFHSNTLAFNGAAEKVAKGLQGGRDNDDVRETPTWRTVL